MCADVKDLPSVRKMFDTDWQVASKAHELSWHIVKSQNAPTSWKDLDRGGAMGDAVATANVTAANTLMAACEWLTHGGWDFQGWNPSPSVGAILGDLVTWGGAPVAAALMMEPACPPKLQGMARAMLASMCKMEDARVQIRQHESGKIMERALEVRKRASLNSRS